MQRPRHPPAVDIREEVIDEAFRIEIHGESPLVAAAIHAGHEVRPELEPLLALTEAERLREEDPFTNRWTAVAAVRIVGTRSRFEVDLNRPWAQAIYRTPDDAWGLKVWRTPLPEAEVAETLRLYDSFYDAAARLLDEQVARYGRFIVYDLHSYNHRREGADAPPADPELNPEVNVGTGSLDRERWGPVIDRFMETLRGSDALGHPLDVRENVKFRGGHFSRWIADRYPETGCVLSIEFRKSFMDEWTGAPDEKAIVAIGAALAETVDPVLEALRQ